MTEKKHGFLRFIGRWTFRAGVLVGLIILIAFLFVFRNGLYNRFYYFPKEAAAWKSICAQYQPVALDEGWTEFRGVCHSHSMLSHDSEVEFEDILKAAHEADISFICMTDHCDGDKADYSKGWKGVHDGVLFVRGYEMGYGFAPWGLPDDVILKKSDSEEALAKTIVEKGGVLFIVHSEESHKWDLPEISGMEIYNIHSNILERKLKIPQLLPDALLSLNKYHKEVMRTIFTRQTEIIKHWDELNKDRRMVGIGGGDAHQNSGFRGYYTEDDRLLVTTTGKDDVLGNWKLNFLTRNLLRVFPGPLKKGEQLFRIEMDPYALSLEFVNNHVFAKSLSEPDILDALKMGRVFVAFDMIADARGFTYFAQAGDQKFMMGEDVDMAPGLTLKAGSPYPCRFTLVRDGSVVERKEGRTYEYPISQSGKYRIEAELNILNEWTPWVYTNPIHIK